jgi:hypothetical protein
MNVLVKTLVCRPVHGFSLFTVWSDTKPPRIVRYDLVFPGGALIPFSRDSLGAALKTFHASTDVWFWFSPPYRLYPVFADDTSDQVQFYAIAGPDGQAFKSNAFPDGLNDALKEFERLTGVDITAEDAIGGMT